MGFFEGLIFGPGIFWGCVRSPRDFFGFDISNHSINLITGNPTYPLGTTYFK